MENVFEKTYGSDILKKPQFFFGVLLIMSTLGYLVAKGGVNSGVEIGRAHV